jgi:hypothetical protein
VIFANVSGQTDMLNRLESIIAADSDSPSSGEEEYEGTNIPKHETGKIELSLKKVTKFMIHKSVEYKIILCPQAPLVGNFRRKVSFFPRLSSSNLRMMEIACIVYSVDDEKSFSFAEDLLMQMEDLQSLPTVLLVANAAKSLLKHRVISAERGMKCAEKYGCIGFFEFNPIEVTEADRVLKAIMDNVHELHDKLTTTSMSMKKKNDISNSGDKNRTSSSIQQSKRTAIPAPEVIGSAPTPKQHDNEKSESCCVLS